MRLVPNWKKIATRASSQWAGYLGLLVLVVPEALFYFLGLDLNPRVTWCVGVGLIVYQLLSRLLDQGIDRDTLKSHWAVGFGVLALLVCAIGFGDWSRSGKDDVPGVVPVVSVPDLSLSPDQEFLAQAVPFVGRWEGLRLVAYRDLVGVWTVCYGETKGVSPGDVYTKPECDAMFSRELLEYRSGLHAYFSAETIAARLPVARDVAFASLAYNVGVSGAGKSTATRRLNDGNVAGACNALTWWNKAGGRVVRGLVNRRTDEQELCLQGAA